MLHRMTSQISKKVTLLNFKILLTLKINICYKDPQLHGSWFSCHYITLSWLQATPQNLPKLTAYLVNIFRNATTRASFRRHNMSRLHYYNNFGMYSLLI